MYPFGGLPENLAGFCALLRREYGFHIGAGELLDAARALDIVDLSNQQAVRSALRTVLAGTSDDVAVFDAAFDRFFLSRPVGRDHDQASALQRDFEAGPAKEAEGAPERRRTSDVSAAEMEDATGEGTGPMTPLETTDEEGESKHAVRASYSPVGMESSEAPEVSDVDDAWVAAARALVRRVRLGPWRKWRAAAKGRRFDLRRTLRASLQTGGEPLAPRWLARPRRQPRFIVLIDGSRSMSQHAGTVLKLASALATAEDKSSGPASFPQLEQPHPQPRGRAGSRFVRQRSSPGPPAAVSPKRGRAFRDSTTSRGDVVRSARGEVHRNRYCTQRQRVDRVVSWRLCKS
jgi:uncharacterized protein with von Willebrand factor type A (vWA) domain